MKPGPRDLGLATSGSLREIGGEASASARGARARRLRLARVDHRGVGRQIAMRRRRAAARRRSGRDRGRAAARPPRSGFSSSAATRAWKSAKMFMHSPSSSAKRAPLSQVGGRSKRRAIFMEGETVGHAGDVIRGRAGALPLLRLRRPVARHRWTDRAYRRRTAAARSRRPFRAPRSPRDGDTCWRTGTS